MDCAVAQERILESLAVTRLGVLAPDIESHLAGCEACRSFSEIQTMLDLQLSAAICAQPLSATFRPSLAKRLSGERLSDWSGFFPDVAHLAGGAFATVLCVWLLPFAAASVMLAGLVFTGVTYIIQAAFRTSIEAWAEDLADRY